MFVDPEYVGFGKGEENKLLPYTEKKKIRDDEESNDEFVEVGGGSPSLILFFEDLVRLLTKQVFGFFLLQILGRTRSYSFTGMRTY